MLAKPEYFSPPDEVCCWPGRLGGNGRDAVAEVLLAGALREGWSEAEVCAEKLPLSGDLSGGNALLRLQRGKVCRCSGDVVGSQCCIIGKPLAEAQAAGAGAKAQNLAADAS